MLDGLFNVSILAVLLFTKFFQFTHNQKCDLLYMVNYPITYTVVSENFRRIKICVSIMPSVLYAVVFLASIEAHTYMTKHSRF